MWDVGCGMGDGGWEGEREREREGGGSANSKPPSAEKGLTSGSGPRCLSAKWVGSAVQVHGKSHARADVTRRIPGLTMTVSRIGWLYFSKSRCAFTFGSTLTPCFDPGLLTAAIGVSDGCLKT